MLTLPPSCDVVVKSGNLNFLEPSGPLQACDGTALPFIVLKKFLCYTEKIHDGTEKLQPSEDMIVNGEETKSLI